MFSKKNDTNLFKKMTIMLKSDYEVFFLNRKQFVNKYLNF